MFGNRFFGNRFFGGRYWGHVGAAAPTPLPDPSNLAQPTLTDYQILVKSPAGVLQAVITDFLSLAYNKVVNEPGLCVFSLSGNHQAISYLENNSQIEIWRRNQGQGIDWYCDFYGLYREPDRRGARPGIFAAYCPGQLSMLAWRIVAWPAATTNRSQFTSTAAETIMKTLVNYNAGASATTGNGRERTGTITGVSVEADGAGGNSLDWNCGHKNLLETLQEIAFIAGGDFDLVKTAAQAWEFRWYEGQLGTDRSADVIFALDYDNMANPRYRLRRLGEKTVAIVGGQGVESGRTIEVRTGANYNASTNNIEAFVDARNITTTAGLQTRGDQYLEASRAYDEFYFDVLQTAVSAYGKHYFLGDLVTAVSPYTGLGVTRKIKTVSVSLDRKQEQIGVETADV